MSVTDGAAQYRDAFLARCRVQRQAGQEEVDGPGLHGLAPSMDTGRAGLLVTDDRALPALAELLTEAGAERSRC